jgi:hypothetical protein
VSLAARQQLQLLLHLVMWLQQRVLQQQQQQQQLACQVSYLATNVRV